MRNKYIKNAKISEAKFRVILKLFCLGLEAQKVDEFVDANRVTENRIFNKIRERIAKLCEAESPFVNGEIELDESYFGARRVRGVRGLSAKGKTPVFGDSQTQWKGVYSNRQKLFCGRVEADYQRQSRPFGSDLHRWI